MRRFVAFCFLICVVLVGWHLLIWSKLPSNADIDVNPLTDVAHVRTLGASQLGITDARAIAAFNGARDLVGGTIGDRQLANISREYFDLYAMIFPYHVIVSDEKPPSTVNPLSASPVIRQRPRTGEYLNERFGFRFSRPNDFVAGRSPENGDGIHLTSQDGAAIISASGSNSSGASLQEYYDEYLKEISVAPSYSHIGNGWFVLSWTKNNRISYVKMFVGSSSQNTLTFEYPEDEADIYKPVAAQLERTFRPGGLNQSW